MSERLHVTVSSAGSAARVELVLVVDNPDSPHWEGTAEAQEPFSSFKAGEVEVTTDLRGALAWAEVDAGGTVVFHGRTAFSVGG